MILFAFLPEIAEKWEILSSHFVAHLKVVLNPGPFEQGSSYVTIRAITAKLAMIMRVFGDTFNLISLDPVYTVLVQF